jgi:hypothetical protein
MVCLLSLISGGQRPANASSTTDKTEHETCNGKHDEDEEQYFRDAGSTGGDAAENPAARRSGQ